MKLTFGIYTLAVIVLAVSSCKNLYVQKNVFVPLTKQKGDMRIEGNMGREAVALNTAYAFNKQFSVMLNGFNTIDNSGTYRAKYNRQLEAGIGYYKLFRDSFHFESYIGGSYGWFNSSYERSKTDYETLDIAVIGFAGFYNPLIWLIFFSGSKKQVYAAGNYQTAFFQNTISAFSKNNSTSFTGRLQYIQFNDYLEEGEFSGQKIKYSINVPPKIFFQPVLTNKYGIGKNVRFTNQFGYNIEIFGNPEDVFEWNKFFFSMGLEVGFNTKKK